MSSPPQSRWDPEVTSPVRPFRARLVHQERAADLVTPMVDSVDVPVQQPDLDDAAYDAPVSALYVYRQRRGSDQHVGVAGVHLRCRAFGLAVGI